MVDEGCELEGVGGFGVGGGFVGSGSLAGLWAAGLEAGLVLPLVLVPGPVWLWAWLSSVLSRARLRRLRMSWLICLLRSAGTTAPGTWCWWGPVLWGRRVMVPLGWRW